MKILNISFNRTAALVILITFGLFCNAFAADDSNPAQDAVKKIQDLNSDQGQQGDLDKNFIVKLFEKIYGEFDSNLSTSAVMGIIAIAIIGVFMLRSSPIIGLIMILAPTSVFFFIQKALDMLK